MGFNVPKCRLSKTSKATRRLFVVTGPQEIMKRIIIVTSIFITFIKKSEERILRHFVTRVKNS